MSWIKKISIVLICCVVPFWAMAQFEYIEVQEQKEKQAEKISWLQCGKNNRPLRVSSFTTNPPFSWTERRQVMDHYAYYSRGYNVDFLKDVTNDLNIQAEFVGYKTDEEMINAFVRGDLDIVVGMYYDTANYGKIATTIVPSYMQNFVSVVFMKGKEKDVKSFKDLAGLKGVVRTDEHFYDYVYRMMPEGIEMLQVSNSKEAFTKLLTGEVDYMLASPYSAEAEARRFKMNLEISMLQVPLLGQELFVMQSKKSPCPKFGKMIAKKIREKRQDMPAMQRKLISYIDDWGQRFKNDPSLREQLGLTQSKSAETGAQTPVPQTSSTEMQSPVETPQTP